MIDHVPIVTAYIHIHVYSMQRHGYAAYIAK